MDEPFGALDAITRDRLQEELLRIQRGVRKTILFVTHDVQEAFKLGDQIVVLSEGRLIQEGSTIDLLARPADDFVRRLVGADSVLRQLEYLPVTMALEPATEVARERIPATATLLRGDASPDSAWGADAAGRGARRAVRAGLGLQHLPSGSGQEPRDGCHLRRPGGRLRAGSVRHRFTTLSEDARVSFILNGANWDLSQPNNIPSLILAQLGLTLVSVAIGLAIAFPLALLVSTARPSYRPIFNPARYYGPLIGVTDVLYTIPSLAFMALLVPVTGLTPATIIIPLVAYTQLVLIRNIVAARHAVDPTLLDVGRAMGMNGVQLQRYVVLPLSLPLIVAGLRVVTVTSIGIATIAPLIGVEDIGTLIFQGFNFSYNDEILAGVIIVSVVAIAADLLLLAIQSVLSRGRQLSPVS